MAASKYTRRGVLGGAAALLLPGALHAGAPAQSLVPKARPGGASPAVLGPAAEIVAGAGFKGDVAFALVECGTGRVLETLGGEALPPASVAKVLTSLYALEALGPEYRFDTRLVATGPLRDGRLEGDLVLAGGGDPTLDTDALAEMAAELKAAGVREITGGFRVWGGALAYQSAIDPEQLAHLGYNPAVSGLNLNYNRVHFEWRRAGADYGVTMDARSARYRPEVQISRMQIAPRSFPVYTYQDEITHDAWTVARGALGNDGARWLPVRKPAHYAGEVLAGFARSHGIVLGAPSASDRAPTGETLVRHQSAPLEPILKDMLRYSTNLTAEAVGMSASAARLGRSPDALALSAAEMSAWARARLGMTQTAMVDHSGLGDASRLSSGGLAQALAGDEVRTRLFGLLKSFELGEAGKSHPGLTVVAKTGTLNFVSALAGYLNVPGRAPLAFAILTSDTEARTQAKESGAEIPVGARSWNARSRGLQRAILARWGQRHTS
ncbi:D-alanyl-D-alanine carboxypeptidase / D-alanyl-D-alanine-endopeptidase (penicillin-binding protein 4) [Poseidonocella pacifica]|uniref:D-alanyl-D-alanine carboxypeptidase / D-alanyl-D-alanine-endopeptidase (Penicillin-binding protein 4) n=1 Tax=Poseidonocella pacifica TaxID=871651 RepID=A0A1I0YBQ2_9RHOB|nr:D-alanyl-D-alanine carboxypeptidase/D-alanyl-D-alanine-endopeptidase [Poseidonocella pacifica]SFB10825.1 D-alanyl-D-alanine carboxypeptidase / D-alanyl-D-alanine-endopeptidase (penicillin-binding protein 4) [Poseidonocella pacifica]